MDMTEIARLIEQQGTALEQFKTAQATRVDELAKSVDDVLLKAARPGGMGGAQPPAAPLPTFIDTKSKARIPVLRPTDSLAALEVKTDAAAPSMGRVLRGLVMGGHADDARELADERKALSIDADPSGGYTVAGMLASQWVDRLRAQMVLSRAGALTVPMDSGELTLAKVTGDPTVSWHKENADLTATEPTFGAVSLRAKTVVCLVRLSLELSQDSANIEQMLQSTIAGSMAGAIDAAGLVGVTTGAAAAPQMGGIFNLTGRNSVTSIGVPADWDFVVDGMYELLADNVPQESIGALIGHPKLWRDMRKLKTGISGDNTPLPAPAEVAALPKLWTTAAPLSGGTTTKAAMANWSDLLFGVRKGISVNVLSQRFLADNLQVAVLAYARVDFAAVRPESFVTLEGITVA